MKRFTFLAVSFALIVLLVAACGGNSEESGSNANTSNNNQSENVSKVEQTDNMQNNDSNETVTLEFISWAPFEDALFEEFYEENPGIKINYQQIPSDTFHQVLRTRLIGGDSLDIAGIQEASYEEFVAEGLIEDITDEPLLDNYYDWALDQARAKDGKIYALPMGTFAEGAFYNKDMFKELNLEIPTTMEEYVNVLKTLKENGITPIAQGNKNVYTNWNNAIGYLQPIVANDPDIVDKLNDGSAKFTDPEFVEAFKNTKALIDNEYISANSISIDPSQAAQMLAQEKVAIQVQGAWMVNTFKDIDLPFELGVFAIPVQDDQGSNYSVHIKGIKTAVVSSSEKKEAALKFLDFLSRKDGGAPTYYGSAGHFPTVKGVEAKEPLLNLWEPAINNPGHIAFRDQLGQATVNALYTGLQELYSDKPIEDIVNEIQKIHEKSLE